MIELEIGGPEKSLLLSMAQSLEETIVCMQSAYIEWKHGGGAEAAMEWIFNRLDGPGIIPPDDATDAQAWSNAHSPLIKLQAKAIAEKNHDRA